MQVAKIIWIIAFIICSLGFLASILASIITLRIGHKDRLKYILPLMILTLAGMIESFFSILRSIH